MLLWMCYYEYWLVLFPTVFFFLFNILFLISAQQSNLEIFLSCFFTLTDYSSLSVIVLQNVVLMSLSSWCVFKWPFVYKSFCVTCWSHWKLDLATKLPLWEVNADIYFYNGWNTYEVICTFTIFVSDFDDEICLCN